MPKERLIDPAELTTAEERQEDFQKDEEILSIDNLKMADMTPVPHSAARIPAPFEGYPMKEMKIGEYKGKPLFTKATYVVIHNPNIGVVQDPSGKGITITSKNGAERMVDIPTTHSRMVRDWDTKRNNEVVFDRPMVLEDGRTAYYAVIESHSVRSQLIYEYDTKLKRVVVNRDYILVDKKQVSRLKQTFLQIINPKLRQERLAEEISKE